MNVRPKGQIVQQLPKHAVCIILSGKYRNVKRGMRLGRGGVYCVTCFGCKGM